MLQRTAYARERLAALDGVTLLHDQPVVREFALALDAPVERVIARCLAQGINPGYPLGRDYPEYGDGLLVAITERRTRAEIDRARRRRSRARSRPSAASGYGAGAAHDRGRRRRADDLRALASRAAARSCAPALDVPERPLDELLAAEPAPRAAAAAAGGLRARDRAPLQPPVEAQLRPRHGLLPARLVHDEAQPEAPRAGRGAARARQAAPAPATPSAPRGRSS